MSEEAERNFISRGKGKWSQAGVPHKGWQCIDVEDLGAPNAVCEMCESQEIRYVHYMEHRDYQNVLGAGCVCAGHMEDDYVGARKRERALKNASLRRVNWLKRKWRKSAKGNPYLNTDGYNVVVFRVGNKWSGAVTDRESGVRTKLNQKCENMDEAKLAAFGVMLRLKEDG